MAFAGAGEAATRRVLPAAQQSHQQRNRLLHHCQTVRQPHRKPARLALVLAALAAACGGAVNAPQPGSPSRADEAALPAQARFDYEQLRSVHGTSSAAARAFLDALSPAQREQAVFDFDDPRRSQWSNLPPFIFEERNGVALGDLAAAQAEALHRFLAAALSANGYATTMAVLGAEDQLAASSTAGRSRWSSGNYWLAFFGEPAANAEAPWGWQFGGHHLAINITVAGGRSTLSPTFVGIEPAQYATAAGIVAPLAEHRAAGLGLINALDEPQRHQALADARPREILAGAGKDGFVPAVDGVAVGGWNAALQQRLLDLVELWLRMMPADSAMARLAEVQTDLARTHFTWHGDTDGSGAIYYRVQGPRLIVEFSTQGRVGADGGHYHSIYRDPTNEYGRAATP